MLANSIPAKKTPCLYLFSSCWACVSGSRLTRCPFAPTIGRRWRTRTRVGAGGGSTARRRRASAA